MLKTNVLALSLIFSLGTIHTVPSKTLIDESNRTFQLIQQCEEHLAETDVSPEDVLAVEETLQKVKPIEEFRGYEKHTPVNINKIVEMLKQGTYHNTHRMLCLRMADQKELSALNPTHEEKLVLETIVRENITIRQIFPTKSRY
jgi:hypothetical protein